MIPDIRFLKQTLEDAGCDDRMIGECIKIAETRPSAELLKPLCPLPRRPSGTSARKPGADRLSGLSALPHSGK